MDRHKPRSEVDSRSSVVHERDSTRYTGTTGDHSAVSESGESGPSL
jgi:hypothetical protein